MDDLEKRVTSVMAESLGCLPNVLEAQDTFEQLNVDSLDLVEMKMDLEQEFGLLLEEEEFLKLNSVKEVVALIRTKTK